MIIRTSGDEQDISSKVQVFLHNCRGVPLPVTEIDTDRGTVRLFGVEKPMSDFDIFVRSDFVATYVVV